MELKYNILYLFIIFSLFLLGLSTSSNYISLADASPDAQNDIIQMPSEATDFPGNNQDGIEILFTKTVETDTEEYHIKGSIKNNGENTLGAVKVTAHFFDENNKPIGITTCCNASPSDMEPGHTSSFDSFASAGDMAGTPTYYRMSFEWDKGKNEAGNNGYIELDDTNPKSSESLQPTSPLLDTEPVSTDLSCGEVVTTNVKLSANLYCTTGITDGIIVGGDGITIDLNGYTIKGPGPASSKMGIKLANNNGVQVLGPGTITNFQAGILNTGGDSNSIRYVTFTENEIAIFNKGGAKNSSIQENMMDSNKIGFASNSSSGTVMKTNLLLSNALAGVTLVNSPGNEISTNIIKGSVNGIFVDGQSTLNNVNTNTVVQNTGVDLNNGNGLDIRMNNNTYTDNNCNMSVPGGLCIGY